MHMNPSSKKLEEVKPENAGSKMELFSVCQMQLAPVNTILSS